MQISKTKDSVRRLFFPSFKDIVATTDIELIPIRHLVITLISCLQRSRFTAKSPPSVSRGSSSSAPLKITVGTSARASFLPHSDILEAFIQLAAAH